MYVTSLPAGLPGSAVAPEAYAYNRPPFHPFGYASTGNDDLAFIRISKNASSSFVTSLNLGDWTHASGLGGHKVYCALREPVARFYSSVTETVLRARIYQDAGYYGDIVIDPADYFEMQTLLSEGRLESFLWYMIETIETRGPFDAHHERQVRFLEDFSGLDLQVTFFDVAEMNTVLAGLLERYKGQKADANRRRDGQTVKPSLGNMRALTAELTRRARTEPFSPRHLLFPADGVAGPVKYGSEAFDARLKSFSGALKRAATPELDAKIAEVYAADMAFYTKVAAHAPAA